MRTTMQCNDYCVHPLPLPLASVPPVSSVILGKGRKQFVNVITLLAGDTWPEHPRELGHCISWNL